MFDNAIESIKRRFDQEDFKKWLNLKQPFLKAIEQNSYQEEFKISKDLFKEEFSLRRSPRSPTRKFHSTDGESTLL